MIIGIVLGTRPEILKNYSVVKALRGRDVTVHLIYTNQHSDYSMCGAFFEAMQYSADFVLEGEYALGRAIDWIRGLIAELNIDLIIVNGDTAAALIGGVAAQYTDTTLAHIEAGLRSGDEEMYEERNRIIVDSLAHYLFTYTKQQQEYLESLPDVRGRVFHVGNTTVDLIEDFKDRIVAVNKGNYMYVTLHRKEFTDDMNRMLTVFDALRTALRRFDHVFFPIHPRTRDVMRRRGIAASALDGVTVLDPIPVFESLSYMKHAGVILTDSGCMQEEAYLFGVPCVTVRENTERHCTVRAGANIVCGFAKKDILDAIETQLRLGVRQYPPVYGEYGAGERIADIIINDFENRRADTNKP